MADYLTENAIFSCSMSSAVVIRCKETSNKKVKYKGTVLLTKSAKIDTAIGNCPILTAQTGTPQMCQCSLSIWTNKSMSTTSITAQGIDLLTENTSNLCMYGGKISVKLSGVSKRVVKGSKANISSVKWLKPFVETTQKNTGKIPKSVKSVNINNSSSLKAGGLSSQVINQEKIVNTSDFKSNTVQPLANKAEIKLKPQNLLCNMDKGERCKHCRYPSASVEVNNDPIKLRRNYESQSDDEKDDYDHYYEDIFDNFTEKYWTDAAHHIISGNQVFKKCQAIVKLANFYNEEYLSGNTVYKGYDINSAKNCIMLISKDVEYSKKLDSKVEKNISAYDAMSTTGIQWHLGGHSYTFNKEEIPVLHQRIKLFTKKEARELKNYAELVEEELNKIQISMCKNKVCRATPRQNAAFVTRMNNLSAKIKKYLGDFRIKPHRSYPYYVSQEAFSYTFNKEEIPVLHQRIKLFTKKEARELKNYAELVEEELNKIQISMCKNKVCRATPRQNAAFVTRMNNLSAKIKKYLGDFRIKPHRSYPYYVSQEAFRYTFSLPRTGKIMLVRQGNKENSLLLEKFRVKRFEDTIMDRDKNLDFSRIFNEQDGQNPKEFVFNDGQSKKDCIYFCDNIEHFILIDNPNLNLLPFKIDVENILSLQGIEKISSEQFLQQHDTEILVFLRNNVVTYTAPLKKIKERLQLGG